VDIQVDERARYARTPSHEVSLPPLDDVPMHEPALPDRVGEAVRELRWIVAGGAATGAVMMSARSLQAGRGILGSAIRGAAGIGVGAAAVIGAGVLINAIRGDRGSTAAAVPASPTVTSDEQLRVMTFNIHGANGPYGQSFGGDAEIEAIARTIEQQHPDVVLLQEVNDFSIQNGFRNVHQQLADRLDADGAAFTPGIRNATGREHGNAVLTFNGVHVSDARGLVHPDPAGDGLVRRAAGMADTAIGFVTEKATGTARAPFGTIPYRGRATSDVMITTPAGNAVRVLSGHYSWPTPGDDAPRHEVDPVAGLLGAWDGPTLLGADFNVASGTPDGDLEEAVFRDRAGMTDAFTQMGLAPDARERGSFTEGPGGSPIDRIYASKQLRPTAATVVPFDPDAGPASSDHRPVVVDYELQAD
jgi:endonuclease/exonuclease/phosphatase family metal-dependent hydrolase